MLRMRLLVRWVCVCACVCAACGVLTPVLRVRQGRLRGLRSVSGQNRYYGIPYAVSTRFQPPKAPPKWNGTFLAVNRLGCCAQTVSLLTAGSEDCLHLDVYTPEHVARKVPVLVFIHGGAYYYGTKAHYDPEFLVTKNTIVVIINYRVGVLGFLCLNGVANLGLKDQVAALNWIKNNIAVFGGDPDNVTISGQSAGASAAAMHFLSKSSEGLFHKAILMSGTPLSPWAYNLEPLRPAFEDASKLGNVKNELDVYNIFMNASLEDLLESTRGTSKDTRYFKYSPCMDFNSSQPFFWNTPYEVLKSRSFNQVPIMLGFASVEGILFYGINDDEDFRKWDENFMETLPTVFSSCPARERRKISKKIRSHYFGSKAITRKAVKGVVSYYSDWIAYSSVDAFSKLMTQVSAHQVYNYMFSYEGDRNFAKALFGSRLLGMKGASHSDDIFYIFKPAGLSLLLSNADKLFIDRLTTMVTNFMKFGDPTPRRSKLLPLRWPAASANSSAAMLLDSQLAVQATPDSHRGLFLHTMMCQYGERGFAPCEGRAGCG